MKALQFSVSVPQYIILKALGILKRDLYYRSWLAPIKLVDIPEPVLPSPEWVKIKTAMCGMCGSDVNLIFLKDSPSASPFTSFPCILGHELCGEIVEVGNKTGKLKIGDKVTIAPHLNCPTREIEPMCPTCQSGRSGNCENYAEGSLSPGMFTGICADTSAGFAEYLVAHKSQVFVLPDDMSKKTGAMIEPLAVALQAVLDNVPQSGEQVLVIGAGVIGNLIVQTIRALDIDCSITVFEPSGFQAEIARTSGADNVIEKGDLFRQASDITGARSYTPMLGKDILMGGFSRLFDTVGNSSTLNSGLRCLATGGVLSLVGIGHNVSFDPTPLWLKLQTIKGVFSYGHVQHNQKNQHIFDIAIDLADKGKVQLESMVTHTFTLEQFSEMIEINLSKGANQAMKTAVSFDSG
jgi:(R,R)-butanediol dehydrogenase/meso-butanediol dehydrogenase/diacetyl reductase